MACFIASLPPRAAPRLEQAQLRLNQAFTATAGSSLLPSTASLTRRERCLLLRSERLASPRELASTSLVRAVMEQQAGAVDSMSRGCPPSSLPGGCGVGDLASCAWQQGLPLHGRDLILRHSLFAAKGDAAHLVSALSVLQRYRLQLLVVGESTAAEIIAHSNCELARHGAQSLNSTFRLAYPHGERFPVDGALARLHSLNTSLEELALSGGGVVRVGRYSARG
ncbi:MAG: hypothetical protein SGPRY_002507 [Prymnesium sp.]